jgi:DNA-binding transcriptional regulator PaaX
MGILEKKSKKKLRKSQLQKFILTTVQVAGVLAVVVLAGQVITALGKMGFIPRRRQKESIHNARMRLVQRGMLEYRNGFLRLTKIGAHELKRMERLEFRLQRPRRWDGRWRILIFDIPEYRKTLRDKVRRTLISLGFVRLQDSVWAYPYDCEDFVTLLKADFKIGKDLLYMIVDTLEYDKKLREKFGLK